MKIVRIVFALGLIVIASAATAQIKKVLADKIIATVGDKYILRSDVDNALADYKRQAQGQENIELPTPCQVIEGQLIRKALVLQAEKDSILVTEEEIEVAIDGRIRNFIQQFGSKEVLEEVAGRSIFQLKDCMKVKCRSPKSSCILKRIVISKNM